MTDDELPPPHELEQLARSLSPDGALGRNDAQTVAAVLRWVARQRITLSTPARPRRQALVVIRDGSTSVITRKRHNAHR